MTMFEWQREFDGTTPDVALPVRKVAGKALGTLVGDLILASFDRVETVDGQDGTKLSQVELYACEDDPVHPQRLVVFETHLGRIDIGGVSVISDIGSSQARSSSYYGFGDMAVRFDHDDLMNMGARLANEEDFRANQALAEDMGFNGQVVDLQEVANLRQYIENTNFCQRKH